jgi:hypothetical protein
LVRNAFGDKNQKKKNQKKKKNKKENHFPHKFLRPHGIPQRENIYLMKLLRSNWVKTAM